MHLAALGSSGEMNSPPCLVRIENTSRGGESFIFSARCHRAARVIPMQGPQRKSRSKFARMVCHCSLGGVAGEGDRDRAATLLWQL